MDQNGHQNIPASHKHWAVMTGKARTENAFPHPHSHCDKNDYYI